MELNVSLLPQNDMNNLSPLSPYLSAQTPQAFGLGGVTAQPAKMPNELVEMSEFNQRAGVHQLLRNYYLSQRMVPLSQRRLSGALRRASESAKNTISISGELESVAGKVIEDLQNSGRSELEARLTASYDVLERHTLLRAAMSQLSDKDLSSEEEDRLKGTLEEMLDQLMKTDGDAIREGLKGAEAFEITLEAMEEFEQKNGETHVPNTLSALRSLYNNKSGRSGGMEEPLAPLALAKELLSRFGPENFSSSLLTLRSRMAVDLRSARAIDTGPRLWLSLSDAASFNALQSCFAIAGDFRRNLSERAAITPGGNQVDTALVLLALPGSSEQAERLANKMIVQKQMKPLQRIQMFMLIRHAVESLSISMWDPRLFQQRQALLTDLRAATFAISDKLVRSVSREKELEQQLREERDRKRKRNRNGEEEEEEGGDEVKK